MVNALGKAIRVPSICLVAYLSLAGMSYAQQARVKPVGRVTVEDSRGKVIGTTLGGYNVNNIELPGGRALNV